MLLLLPYPQPDLVSMLNCERILTFGVAGSSPPRQTCPNRRQKAVSHGITGGTRLSVQWATTDLSPPSVTPLSRFTPWR